MVGTASPILCLIFISSFFSIFFFSSFDNLFLKARVNHIIRELAKTMPIILATHNNTVGASIKPDYLIYTKRCIDGDNVQHERYYGLPSEKELRAASGKLSEI